MVHFRVCDFSKFWLLKLSDQTHMPWLDNYNLDMLYDILLYLVLEEAEFVNYKMV